MITLGNDFSSFHCNPLFLKARGVTPQSSSCWKPGDGTGCTLLLTVQWFHMLITSKHLSEYQIFLTFHCIFYPFMLKFSIIDNKFSDTTPEMLSVYQGSISKLLMCSYCGNITTLLLVIKQLQPTLLYLSQCLCQSIRCLTTPGNQISSDCSGNKASILVCDRMHTDTAMALTFKIQIQVFHSHTAVCLLPLLTSLFTNRNSRSNTSILMCFSSMYWIFYFHILTLFFNFFIAVCLAEILYSVMSTRNLFSKDKRKRGKVRWSNKYFPFRKWLERPVYLTQ